jgi:predicted  nucleic acid-binding Zn-ribbon protein
VKFEASVKQIRGLLQLAELNQEADKLTLEACRRGHEAVQRGLPRIVLERYHALINAGRTPAVVAIEQGTCLGCHVRLPTMLEHRARRSPGLYTCPHCRRMLYASELLRAEPHADNGKGRRAASGPL